MADIDSESPSASSQDARAVVVNPNKKKKGKGKKILLFLLIMFLLGGIAAGAWYLLQTPDLEDELESIAPSDQITTQPTREPSPTEEPVNLSELQVEVLNGTGITGEAGYLQEILEDMGYENIEVGNADNQDYQEAVVTFSQDISDNVRTQMLEQLEDIYIDLEEETQSDLEVDISIITGPRRNASPTSTTAPEPTTNTSTESASTN